MTPHDQSGSTITQLEKRIIELEQRLTSKRSILSRIAGKKMLTIVTTTVVALAVSGVAFASIPNRRDPWLLTHHGDPQSPGDRHSSHSLLSFRVDRPDLESEGTKGSNRGKGCDWRDRPPRADRSDRIDGRDRANRTAGTGGTWRRL